VWQGALKASWFHKRMAEGTGHKGEHYRIGATKWDLGFLSTAMTARCNGMDVRDWDGNEVVCDSVVRQRHCFGKAAFWVSLGFAIMYSGADGCLIIVLDKSGGLQ